MPDIGRAVYTRCYNSINFYSAYDSSEMQKIFATSGDAGLSKDTINRIEEEMKKDIYVAGRRSFLGNSLLYMNSAVLYYRWMRAEETGSRGYTIVKALMGNFDGWPTEYSGEALFKEEIFFNGYFDANGKIITDYRQLLTYHGGKFPDLIPLLSENELSNLGLPAISFQKAAAYVKQSESMTGLLQKAVCYLIKQQTIDADKRRCIVIRGSFDQLRYMFAAIGYAFSARDARSIPFAIHMPVTGYVYSYNNVVLVGWDINESSNVSLPENMIFLEELPELTIFDKNEYIQCISRFDETHYKFVADYMKNQLCGIKEYPDMFRKMRTDERDRITKENDRKRLQEAADRKRLQEEADRKRQDEDDRKRKEEVERKRLEEADRKRKEEADRKRQDEDDRKRKKEDDRKRKEEDDRKRKEEAERKRLEEADHKRKEDANRKHNEEADLKRKQGESDLTRGTQKQISTVPVMQPQQLKNVNKRKILLYSYGKYIGEVIKDKPHGWGVVFYNDWSWKMGLWENGKLKYGFASLNYKTTASEIVSRMQHIFIIGLPPAVYPVGNPQIAIQIGDCNESWGARYWNDTGKWYFGEWKNTRRHGWGIEWYPTWHNNIGDWVNDEFMVIDDKLEKIKAK